MRVLPRTLVVAIGLTASIAGGQMQTGADVSELAKECHRIRQQIFYAPDDPSLTPDRLKELRAHWREIGCSSVEAEAEAASRDAMTDGERSRRCAEIHAEIAHQQNRMLAAPAVASSWVAGGGLAAEVNRNIAALQAEYVALQCNVVRVVPAAPKVSPAVGSDNRRLSFDDCFKKCRELTSRSAEECFDACMH